MIDLSPFMLQLPDATTVVPTSDGSLSPFFYSIAENILFYCFPLKTTPNSSSSRTELYEKNKWDFATSVSSFHTKFCVTPANNTSEIIVNQLHHYGGGPKGPLLFIRWKNGQLRFYQLDAAGNPQPSVFLANVGNDWVSIDIFCNLGVVSIAINGIVVLSGVDISGWSSLYPVYYKCGNYISTTDTTQSGSVLFSEISIRHL